MVEGSRGSRSEGESSVTSRERVACSVKLYQICFITWMIPVVVLGLPILDTTLVVFSRLRRGLNPLTNPGQDHVSHRLVLLGLSHRQAVILYMGYVVHWEYWAC